MISDDFLSVLSVVEIATQLCWSSQYSHDTAVMSSDDVNALRSPEMADHGALSDMVIGTGIGFNWSKPFDRPTNLSCYSASTRDEVLDIGPRRRAQKFPKAKIRSTGKVMNKSRRVKQVGSGNIYRDDETAVTDEFAQELKQKALCLGIQIIDTELDGTPNSEGQAGLLLRPNSTDATLVTALHNLATEQDGEGNDQFCQGHSVETAYGGKCAVTIPNTGWKNKTRYLMFFAMECFGTMASTFRF
jgi:hypothetical protein